MKRPKPESPAKRLGYVLLSLFFALLSVSLLAYLGEHFHPGTSSAASAVLPAADLGTRFENGVGNARADALSDIASIRKHYSIAEDALAAPVPDPENFGTLAVDQAEQLLPVIEKARRSGLLEDQDLLFDPHADFYHDSFIGYYYDETILMIIWKELINGNVCSCMEVKIADASQIRRKIADDTLGSPVQLFASELAAQVNPVVAMNADFYMFRNFGIVVYQRQLWRMDERTYTGRYKNYNCVETCFVDTSGDFHFTHLLDEHSRSELQDYIVQNDILFSLSFGPVLVENGELRSCDWYPAGEPTRGDSRAAIGQLDRLHYFYLSVNHAPEKAALWTVNDMARAMYDKGVPNAYGLDGGQTSEILFRGVPFNHIDYDKERVVSDILYFATAIPGAEVNT